MNDYDELGEIFYLNDLGTRPKSLLNVLCLCCRAD